MRNGIRLTLDYSFGFLQIPINCTAVFVSDETIVYPSGRHLVMYDLNTRKGDFIWWEDPEAL